MKVINKTSDIAERVGEIKEETFKIKASPKAFQILSQGIYTDSITPPIRELATNAWDAHVAAGNEKTPFEVHLPSTLEPWFSIRDFGVGMSEEEIDKIYTTYFESTKTESNDYVGCLGLGSKSPFCYTDTFSVMSIQNGIKLVYTCFLENGVPRCAKLGEETTTDPTGMYIQFSVKTGDIDKFISHAKTIYDRFIHRPKILNYTDFKYSDRTSKFEGDGWRLVSGQSQSYAVMGNIAYPISHKNLSMSYCPNEVSIYYLLNCGVEITFGIGQLEISANRESLHFDDRTIKNIKSRLQLVVEGLKTLVETKINTANTFFDSCVVYESIFRSGKYINRDMASCIRNEKFVYNGKAVDSSFTIKDISGGIEYKTKEYSWRQGRTWNSEAKCRFCEIRGFSINENNMWVINDIRAGGVSKISHYLSNNKEKTVIELPKTVSDKILNYLEIPSNRVMKTSEMESAPKNSNPRVKRNPNIKKLRRIIKTESYYTRGNFSHEEDVDITKNKVNLYVEMVGGSPDMNWTKCKSLFAVAELIGTKGGDAKIYAVNQVLINKIKGLKNWYELSEYCKMQVEKRVKKLNIAQMISDTEYKKSNHDNFSLLLWVEKCIKSNSVECKEISELANRIKKFKETVAGYADDLRWYYIASERLNTFKFEKCKPSENFRGEIEAIMSKFPMINYVSPSGDKIKEKQCAEYIKERIQFL